MAETMEIEEIIKGFVEAIGLDMPNPQNGAFIFNVDDTFHLIFCQHNPGFVVAALISNLRRVDLSEAQALALLQANGQAFERPHIIASLTGERVAHWAELPLSEGPEALLDVFERLMAASETCLRAHQSEESEPLHVPLPKFGSDMVILGS